MMNTNPRPLLYLMDQTVRRSNGGLFNAANPVSTPLFRAQTPFYITHLIHPIETRKSISLLLWTTPVIYASAAYRLAFRFLQGVVVVGHQPAPCGTKSLLPTKSLQPVDQRLIESSDYQRLCLCLLVHSNIPVSKLHPDPVPLSGRRLWLSAPIISPLSSHLQFKI